MKNDARNSHETSSAKTPASTLPTKYIFRFFAPDISDESDRVSIFRDTTKIDQSASPKISQETDNKEYPESNGGETGPGKIKQTPNRYESNGLQPETLDTNTLKSDAAKATPPRSPPLTLTLSSINPTMITLGDGSTDVTFTGTGFTESSRTMFLTNQCADYQNASSPPVILSPTSMRVAVDNQTVQTINWKVCASEGSTTLSESRAVTILPEKNVDLKNKSGNEKDLGNSFLANMINLVIHRPLDKNEVERLLASTKLQGAAVALYSSGAILIQDSDNPLDQSRKPLLGTLHILGAQRLGNTHAKPKSIIVKNEFHNEEFLLTYTSVANDGEDFKRQADVVAVIARAFLLAKISVCKRRLRLTLQTMNNRLSELEVVESRYAILNLIKEIEPRVRRYQVPATEISAILDLLKVPGVITETDLRSIGETLDQEFVKALQTAKSEIEGANNGLEKNKSVILKSKKEIEFTVQSFQFLADDISTIRECLEKLSATNGAVMKSIGETLDKEVEGALQTTLSSIKSAIDIKEKTTKTVEKIEETRYLKLVGLYSKVSGETIAPSLTWWWRKETRVADWRNKLAKWIASHENELPACVPIFLRTIPTLWFSISLLLTYLWLTIPITSGSKQWHDAWLFAYCFVAFAGLLTVASIASYKSIRWAVKGKVCLICQLLMGLSFLLPTMVFAWQYPIDQHSEVAFLAKLLHGFF